MGQKAESWTSGNSVRTRAGECHSTRARCDVLPSGCAGWASRRPMRLRPRSLRAIQPIRCRRARRSRASCRRHRRRSRPARSSRRRPRQVPRCRTGRCASPASRSRASPPIRSRRSRSSPPAWSGRRCRCRRSTPRARRSCSATAPTAMCSPRSRPTSTTAAGCASWSPRAASPASSSTATSVRRAPRCCASSTGSPRSSRSIRSRWSATCCWRRTCPASACARCWSHRPTRPAR